MRKSIVFFGIILIALIVSCTTIRHKRSFGIRHDKTIMDYELVATNKAPFDSDNYPDFSSVISFVYSLDGSDHQDYVATGVLVAPQWILTAGHNFYLDYEQDESPDLNGIKAFTGNDPNNPDHIFDIEKIVYFPSWFNDNTVIEYGNDFCLVKLKSPITSIKPALVNLEKVESIGDTVWICGFGDYSRTRGQDKRLIPKKHAYQNILDRINDDMVSKDETGKIYEGGLLAFDFDNPAGTINSLGDLNRSPDEYLIGIGNNSSSNEATEFESATVEGDSGAPLFMKIDGQWKVAGILSGGTNEPIKRHKDSSYGDISVFTRTANQAEWIKTIINK